MRATTWPRRWAALETEAVAGFDYFRMNDRERLGLPMGPRDGRDRKAARRPVPLGASASIGPLPR
ncbi:hypothetical protein ACRAWD_13685 [Caulobacter segnis]